MRWFSKLRMPNFEGSSAAAPIMLHLRLSGSGLRPSLGVLSSAFELHFFPPRVALLFATEIHPVTHLPA